MASASEAAQPSRQNTGLGPIYVPGFEGCPLYHVGFDHWFAHGAVEWGPRPRMTSRELAMLGVMNTLTDKADWASKVRDEAITAKWHAEALAMPLISEKAWDWCLAELRDKAAEFDRTGRVVCLNGAAPVCKTTPSETLREEMIKAAKPLLDVKDEDKDWHPGSDDKVLNLVHPSLFPLVFGRTRVLASGGLVGVADCLGSYGQGSVAATFTQRRRQATGWFRRPEDAALDHRWSARFQWLPCEVEFTGEDDAETGTSVRITSYINNLHPRHKDLYRVIEKAIGLAIEPWNDVLQHAMNATRYPLRIRTYAAEYSPDRPAWQNGLWAIEKQKGTPEYAAARERVAAYVALPESGNGNAIVEDVNEIPIAVSATDSGGNEAMDPAEESVQEGEGDEEWADGDDTDDEDSLRIGDNWEEKYGLQWTTDLKWKRLRKLSHPEPGLVMAYDDWKRGENTRLPVLPQDRRNIGHRGPGNHEYYQVELQKSYRKAGLQVIVKLASIALTPDKPSYAGGSWHIEGLLNERIAATAIYYYDVANVTESCIAFRTEAVFEEEEDMDYEQDEHEPLAEIFGVASGSLRDETAVQEVGSVATPEGRLIAFSNTLQHRVAPFELMDKTKPGHRRFLVLWLVDPNHRICSTRNVPPQRHDWWAEEGLNKVNFGKLPQEVVDMVQREVGEWPMGLEEAKALRLELMQERTAGTAQLERDFEQYNFCEH